MSIIKKILILLVIIITIITLIYLLKQRNEMIKYFDSLENFKNEEDVQTNIDTKNLSLDNDQYQKEKKSEFSKIENKPILSISSYNSKNDLPLRELVIKSCANTGLTGNYMNLDMIRFLIMRGCRFLDFEVYSIDDVPFIGFSTSDNVTNLDSKNSIPFSDALNSINNLAFQSDSPNSKDPLFIHLRIKTNNNNLYRNIAIDIEKNLIDNLYKEQITGSTKISNIMGKYVILVDKSLANDYDKYPVCESDTENKCYNLKKLTNLESGTIKLKSNKSEYLIQQAKKPPYINDENTTDVSTYQMTLPDNNFNYFNIMQNPNSQLLIKDYGVQIICYNFFNFDKNLEKYEKMFFNFNSAIVPISKCLSYFKSLDE